MYGYINWRRGKHCSRFVSNFDGTTFLRLILDEPPVEESTSGSLTDSDRDEIPNIPCPPGTHRLVFTGDVGEAIWKALCTDRGAETIHSAVGTRQEGRGDCQCCRNSSLLRCLHLDPIQSSNRNYGCPGRRMGMVSLRYASILEPEEWLHAFTHR